MLRTAAHCVHVLTLPIEFRGWRGGEFKLRAQTISAFQFMEFALIYFLWNHTECNQKDVVQHMIGKLMTQGM